MKLLYCGIITLTSLTSIFAQQGGAAKSGGSPFSIQMIGMIILMFVVMYFLMIRPEQKRQKEKQNMLSSIKKGDKVVTIGGILGTITGIKDDSIILKIADNTNIKVLKTAISTVKEKSSEEDETSEDEKK